MGIGPFSQPAWRRQGRERVCLPSSSKREMPWSGGRESGQEAHSSSHPALLSSKPGVGSECWRLRANEVVSNRRR